MKSFTSNELRQEFLNFFHDRQHEIVPSSPLVPGNDPTLLFTNSGMVQFKEVLLGNDKRKYKRAVTSQRCVRAGGKHNDLENVGYTARHHTFFEMLGNFSFGDYFKEDAIKYAWEFLTKVLEIPHEKLWITVFEDDDEAADIWLKKIKIDPARFSRMGSEENFWAMGDTGPCGPCSEIFFDHGSAIKGVSPGSKGEEGDRYIEIWNLVFMQYERNTSGEMKPLPKPSVDTGMGLERIAAVMQGVHSNYEIDLFVNLIDKAAKILGVKNDGASSLNVIADHIRACAFLIADNVLPGNEGRGYVLRRIIRRAIRHGKKLGAKEHFFHKLVAPLSEEMGDAYPEIVKAKDRVEEIIKTEEIRFSETLDQGMEILEDSISKLTDKVIPGAIVFKLYDTYGFPVDLTADIARERGLNLDLQGFEAEMNKQRDRARAASKFDAVNEVTIKTDFETSFGGYKLTQCKTNVVGLFNKGAAVESLKDKDEGAVVLTTSPFYAESGGQIGDSGIIEFDSGSFIVQDTQKHDKAIIHYGLVQDGNISVGNDVEAKIDIERRQAIMLNHSATHLLHASLKNVLGEHVIQKGSYVGYDRLRFDFSHEKNVSQQELNEIENMVNTEIRNNNPAETKLMGYEDAVSSGAVALFGEKYDEEVRVLSFGDFSIELCGGTHVSRSGDIGFFKIITESGIASGVRRIEAVTGEMAVLWAAQNQKILNNAVELLRSAPDQMLEKLQQILKQNKNLEKELAIAKQRILTGSDPEASGETSEVDGIKVFTLRIDNSDAKTLRDATDKFKDKLGSAIVVIGSVDSDKARLAVGVTKNNTDRISAGDIIKPIATMVGGNGGGRSDFAQAGGSKIKILDEALASVHSWVAKNIDQD